MDGRHFSHTHTVHKSGIFKVASQHPSVHSLQSATFEISLPTLHFVPRPLCPKKLSTLLSITQQYISATEMQN